MIQRSIRDSVNITLVVVRLTSTTIFFPSNCFTVFQTEIMRTRSSTLWGSFGGRHLCALCLIARKSRWCWSLCDQQRSGKAENGSKRPAANFR